MRKPWFRQDPERREHERAELTLNFPHLTWRQTERDVILDGPLALNDPGTDMTFERFEISVWVPPTYPADLPVVLETGGRIPRSLDRHISEDGFCCLFVEEEFWLQHAAGFTLADFVAGPVTQFFISQVYFEEHGEWPWGARNHGLDGIVDAYRDLLGIDDEQGIVRAVVMLRRDRLKGHWTCPCGSGERLRDCCRSTLEDLHRKIPPQVFERTWARIREGWSDQKLVEAGVGGVS